MHAIPPLPPLEQTPKGVAIVVCFRLQHGQRRDQELTAFIPHMSRVMAGLQAAGAIKKWHIFIVQQTGSQHEDGIKFNRGKLLNIGFKLAPADFDTFIFHDVDLLPGDDLAPYYAQYPHRPLHIAAC